jgi:glycosyltransferase involved in cell wall biosynthesis
MNELISCIVTSFNSEQFIAEAIRSILNQTYKSIEVIVADGGSTDKTKDVVQKLSSSIKYVTHNSLSPADTRNLGFNSSNGKYVAFLDADDLWHPEKLKKQMNCFIENPELDLCITYAEMFWSEDLKDEKDFFKDHPRTKSIPGYATTTLLAKKKVFEIAGKFKKDLWFTDAAEWFIRAKGLGLKIHIVKEPLTFHRMHNTNLTKRKSEESREEFLSLVKSVLDRKKSDSIK